MLSDLKSKGITNEKVLEVFTIVDRKFFMQQQPQHREEQEIIIGASDRAVNPYLDAPRPIGWGTTISAPSMHAETL